MSTFADLGLDAETVLADLDALGIDTSSYVDGDGNAEEILQSLSLAANLIVLWGISEKSDEIEYDLSDYQITVDMTSGMQETLNDLRDYVSPDDADGTDLIDFLKCEQTYMDITDASLVEVDYTYGDTTYATLQDVLDALDDGSLLLEFLDDYVDNFNVKIYSDSGGAQIGDDTVFDNFINNGYYLQSPYYYDGVVPIGNFYLQVDELKQYFLAAALENAGYISSDIADLNGNIPSCLIAFALTDTPVGSIAASTTFTEAYQLYYGTLPVEFDADEGTVELSMNSMAGLRQMDIDLGLYFQDSTHASDNSWLFIGEDNQLANVVYRYAYDDDWDDYDGKDIDKDDNFIDSDDIDTALEAVATAIESQSNSTEIALLEVNSTITEWGELNDVWDMIHEYIHDALKRAGDNVL